MGEITSHATKVVNTEKPQNYIPQKWFVRRINVYTRHKCNNNNNNNNNNNKVRAGIA
jgi:hypothetical protein